MALEREYYCFLGNNQFYASALLRGTSPFLTSDGLRPRSLRLPDNTILQSKAE